jgi:hypothetical protein
MSDRWDRLAEDSDKEYTREDFEMAFYRIAMEQVLYFADRRSRSSYRLIDFYENDFRAALELMGANLRVNRELRYAAAISRHSKLGGASQDETLVALLLRKLQDEGIQRGEMTEEGEIHCEIPTLQDRYRLETGRALPEKGRLDAILRACKRFGIVRIVDDDDDLHASAPGDLDQPYTIAIRPGIADILGESALERLAQWKPGNADENARAPIAVAANDSAAV